MILSLLITVHLTAALAQEGWRTIPAKENPGFLGPFVQRFSDGFSARTGWGPEMPEGLRKIWLDNMAEPRDFAEEIVPRVPWPRFQWGIAIQSAGGRAVGLYQWFDGQHPERLSREWNRAFCFEKETQYVGVSWTPDLSQMEFFFRADGKLRVRRYENRKLSYEYFLSFTSENGQLLGQAMRNGETLYTIAPSGRIAPRLANAQAARLQFAVEREFLISPRFFRRGRDGDEAVFFP